MKILLSFFFVCLGTFSQAQVLNLCAQNKEKSIVVCWKTTADSSFDEFEVEKTSNNSFASIGIVPACKHSLNGSDYIFTDNNPTWGISYYRLKIKARDSIWYSITVTTSNIKVYPNPTTQYVVVENLSEGNIIQLFAIDGRQLIAPIKVTAETTRQIPLDSYSNGPYIVSVSGIGLGASKISFTVVKK